MPGEEKGRQGRLFHYDSMGLDVYVDFLDNNFSINCVLFCEDFTRKTANLKMMYAGIAQVVEHRSEKPSVASASLAPGTIFL